MHKFGFNQIIEIEVFKNCSQNGYKKFVERFIAAHLTPATNCVYLIRKMQLLHKSNKINQIRAMFIHYKLIKKYGVHIYPSTEIGMGLSIPHPTSIVIGAKVSIGCNFTVYQNTTIGGSRAGDVKKNNQPIIGNQCTLYSGSSILGKVIVGDNCIIGANSLLLSDADENSTYVGMPAAKKR